MQDIKFPQKRLTPKKTSSQQKQKERRSLLWQKSRVRSRKRSMLFRTVHFIQYHNAFIIIFVVLFIGFGAVFAASPDFREGVTGAFVSSETTINSIDNSRILTVDLDNFSFSLEIKAISDDEKNYYVLYSYTTIAIQDGAWNVVEKEKTLTVSKKALGKRDLGLYVTEELGEVIDSTLVYLNKVQKIEREKGIAQKVITTQYAGLVGRFLSPKEKVFSGYEPVIKEAIVESDPTIEPQPDAGFVPEADTAPPPPVEVVTQQLIDRELIREIILELLAQEQDQQSLVVAPSSTEETAPLPETEELPAEESPAPVEDEPTEEPIVEDPALVEEPTPIEEPTPEPVADIISPVITLIGLDTIDLLVGDAYTDQGATAADDVDGDITASIVIANPVDTSTAGTYTVTYTVSDAAGNAATEVTRTVNVAEEVSADVTAPVITLLGSNPVELIVGDTYIEDGATAVDDIDGDITAGIVTVSAVDTATAGIYTITYNVSDAAGNAATEVVRTVNVIEVPEE